MTEHFPLSELTQSDYALRHSMDNTPSGEAVDNLLTLAEGLERVRTVLGNHPVNVTSGFRSNKVNSAVGGSKHSYHQRGLAADFTVHHLTPFNTCRVIEQNKDVILYDKLIHEYGGWVHIQFSDVEIKPRLLEFTIRNKTEGYLKGILEA